MCEKKQNGRSTVQDAIYEVAKVINDERILRLCENYDFLSAEAYYHQDCYLKYRKKDTRRHAIDEDDIEQEQSPYMRADEESYQSLQHYIRREIIQKQEIINFTDLTAFYERLMKERGFDIDKTEKKKLRRRVKEEFDAAANMFKNEEGRLIFLPNDISKETLAIEILNLRKQLNAYLQRDSKEKVIGLAAETIRTEVKAEKSNISWPPQIQDIKEQKTVLPRYLNLFLIKLFGSSADVPEVRLNSIGQDILYAVSKGRFLTTEHVLLSLAVKSLTGNVELIKILNRLGHGISRSKVAEIEAALAMQKISNTASILPAGIQTNVQVCLVFDNIDRLEETLSGDGTTHRVNGIAIQEAFIGPLQIQPKANIERSKKRSIDVCVFLCFF